MARERESRQIPTPRRLPTRVSMNEHALHDAVRDFTDHLDLFVLEQALHDVRSTITKSGGHPPDAIPLDHWFGENVFGYANGTLLAVYRLEAIRETRVFLFSKDLYRARVIYIQRLGNWTQRPGRGP